MQYTINVTDDLQRSREREFTRQLIPAGSLTWVRIEVQRQGQYTDADGVLTTKTGVRQIPLQLTVIGSQYDGAVFWDKITLPEACQPQQAWTDGQRKSFVIGAESIGKILAASNRPLNAQIPQDLDDCRAPVKIVVEQQDRGPTNRVGAWLDPGSPHDKIAAKIPQMGMQEIARAPVQIASPAAVPRPPQPQPRPTPPQAQYGYGQPIAKAANDPDDDIPF